MDGDGSSSKSDMYSFSIVIWEVLSREIPWSGESKAQQIFYRVVLKGERPHIPSRAPPYLVDMARACWAKEPEKRPTFSSLLAKMRLGEWSEPQGRGQTMRARELRFIFWVLRPGTCIFGDARVVLFLFHGLPGRDFYYVVKIYITSFAFDYLEESPCKVRRRFSLCGEDGYAHGEPLSETALIRFLTAYWDGGNMGGAILLDV